MTKLDLNVVGINCVNVSSTWGLGINSIFDIYIFNIILAQGWKI